MHRLWSCLFGLMALAAVQLLALAASHAEGYPWCAQYGSDNGGTNCGFTTYEQCRAAVSGNAGFCVRNQFYSDSSQPKGSKRKPAQR
jgi:hypothetical protein